MPRRPIAVKVQALAVAALGLGLVAFLLALLACKTARSDATNESPSIGYQRLKGDAATRVRSPISWSTGYVEASAARAWEVAMAGLPDLGAAEAGRQSPAEYRHIYGCDWRWRLVDRKSQERPVTD